MYGSMGGKKNKKLLEAMASEINEKATGEKKFNASTVTELMQTDGDNCVVFICRLFWPCVSSDAPRDVPVA
ncbi:hypothetical protein DVH05_002681 [Phytophthora capsici]|nr:hypothetical protein DVH05_002681 [Phytophthora capsici]